MKSSKVWDKIFPCYRECITYKTARKQKIKIDRYPEHKCNGTRIECGKCPYSMMRLARLAEKFANKRLREMKRKKKP